MDGIQTAPTTAFMYYLSPYLYLVVIGAAVWCCQHHTRSFQQAQVVCRNLYRPR
jgi:hypothetical protein